MTSRAFAVATLVLLVGCGGAVESPDASAPNDAGVRDAGSTDDAGSVDAGPTDAGVRIDGGVYAFTLDAGAFPPSATHPSVVAVIPDGFRVTSSLEVVVFLHGFDNCVSNVVLDDPTSCDPSAGTPVRNAYALASQLQASGKNAVLICPELAFDQATGDPGRLGDANGFRALLSETLDRLAPEIGPHAVDTLQTVIVSSHSGGYEAAAGIVRTGGVPVNELWLFDSLYGFETDFDAWVKSDLPGLSTRRHRFGTVYTAGGGTLDNAQAMATRATTWVSPDSGVLLDDRTTDTWADADYLHGLLFKASMLSHDGVPRYYFEHFLKTSQLDDR